MDGYRHSVDRPVVWSADFQFPRRPSLPAKLSDDWDRWGERLRPRRDDSVPVGCSGDCHRQRGMSVEPTLQHPGDSPGARDPGRVASSVSADDSNHPELAVCCHPARSRGDWSGGCPASDVQNHPASSQDDWKALGELRACQARDASREFQLQAGSRANWDDPQGSAESSATEPPAVGWSRSPGWAATCRSCHPSHYPSRHPLAAG